MRSTLPKVLHRIGGRSLLETVLDTAERLSPSATIVVVGAGRGRLESALAGRPVALAVQEPPLGTGDAARCALPLLEDGKGPIVVLSGDAPLLRPGTLAALVAHRRAGGLDLAFLSFRPPEPGALGRVVRDARGRVRRIVEAKDAGSREAKITEMNAGIYCFAPEALSRSLAALKKNPASGEFYLTD